MSRLPSLFATLGLGLAVTTLVHASEPQALTPPKLLDLSPGGAVAATVHDNRALAETVAVKLRQCKNLKNFQIDLSVDQGVVEIDGRVATAAQQAEVRQLVAAVPGVVKVVERLAVSPTPLLVPAQATLEAPKALFGDPPVIGPQPKPEVGPPPVGPAPGGPLQEPTPIFQAPPPPLPGAYTPPKMPPYAWPTYAPYNNFSRVAYPNLYSYNSWPFIGPVYPFPKIPPGWRSVTLQWRDGFWWYGRNSTGYDWWTTRYW